MNLWVSRWRDHLFQTVEGITMKVLQIGFALIFVLTKSVYASEQSVCQFLPESEQPNWVNSTGKDSDYYYAVGGASGKQGKNYLEINQFINQARQDAINNLAGSIRSGIKISTKRTIESKKEGKSKAEIRKEVKQQTEVVSQVALSAVIDDARWLDRDNCLLWYRVKVSKAGAEFAVKAYVNQVAEKLNRKIEQLTHREIEQILSDNGFSPTMVRATQALLNNSTAYYRGQSYNVAELYNLSGFDWLNEAEDSFYNRSSISTTNPNSYRYYYYLKNNTPTQIVRSNSSLSKQIHALTQLKLFGIDLNQVRVSIGKQQFYSVAGRYNVNKPNNAGGNSIFLEKNGNVYRKTRAAKLTTDFKTPLINNFSEINKKEKLGLLHFAIDSYRKDLIEPLIKLGVDINQQSQFGYTPLAFAIESGQLDIAQKLLTLGADPSVNDYLAYKLAYLLQHLNNVDFFIETFGVPAATITIRVSDLADTINKMKLNARLTNNINNKIKQKFPTELTITTVKMAADFYNYDRDNIVRQVFLNGEKVK